MTIKDENGKLVEVKAENILAFVKNGTIDSPIKTLVLFKGDTFGYMFSTEEQEELMAKSKKELKE